MPEEIVRKYRKCPCTKTCPERTATCHATCRKYAEWTAEEQVVKHRKWTEEQRYVISDTKRRRVIRNMKRNKK